MPELPEVETIKRGLEPYIIGKKITKATVLRPSQLKNSTPLQLSSRIEGKMIERLIRRGKYLLFFCSDDQVLAIHLRMTGQLLYYPTGYAAGPYTRLVLSLGLSAELHLRDVRALAQITLLTTDQLSTWKSLSALGPEPFSAAFTPESLQQALLLTRTPIKNALLSQRIVVGLGNIYADEALFRAGINPLHPANTLTVTEIERLWVAIRQTLSDGIAHGGTSIRDYVNAGGIPGSNQQHLWVYGRKGQQCKRCASKLVGCRLAGRSTVYCPKCQPLKGIAQKA